MIEFWATNPQLYSKMSYTHSTDVCVDGRDTDVVMFVSFPVSFLGGFEMLHVSTETYFSANVKT